MTSNDMYTIACGPLSAVVSAEGAELQRFTHAGHGELLWDGDPTIWKGRAPLLFPIVGALEGGSYRYGDRTYALPRHGFARTSHWQMVVQEPHAVTFQLSASDETRAVFPFEFELDMRYALQEKSLSMVATLRNVGAIALPASFGFHPAFRRPLPYGDGSETIEFAEHETAPIRRLTSGGTLAAEPIPTPVHGRTLELVQGLFDNDALVFDTLQSRSLTYGAAGKPGLRIRFDGMPHLGIWAKPDAPFVCIEPWYGYADPEGYAGDLGDKPGVVIVGPGEQHRFAMDVDITDAGT